MGVDAPDVGGPSLTQEQAKAFAGAQAVGGTTSTGAQIAPAGAGALQIGSPNITTRQAGLIADAGAVGRVTSTGAPIRKEPGGIPGGQSLPARGAIATAAPAPTAVPEIQAEPVTQAPAPAPAPAPVVAEEKPRGRRAPPLGQAGRRRSRFFARRGRSSIQVGKPAGAGLSIRRTGVAGAF